LYIVLIDILFHYLLQNFEGELVYDAKAIGAGSDAAQASLQEAYNKVSVFLRLHKRL
jgi:hypothetical protein